MPVKKSNIQQSVEKWLEDHLKKNSPTPTTGEEFVITASLKYLSISVKLDENTWGEQLPGLENNDDPDDPEVSSQD